MVSDELKFERIGQGNSSPMSERQVKLIALSKYKLIVLKLLESNGII
jgi:hypothetical protein